MVHRLLLLLFPILIAASEPRWDPAPWLGDLAQIRAKVERDYPNRDWLVREREVDLDRWFDRAAAAIRDAGDDAGAQRALDALVERFDDGHVALRWPSRTAGQDAPAAAPPTDAAGFCAARGYDASQVSIGTAAALPGYRAIDGGGPFAAGLVAAADTTVGVIRIGVFSPQGYPSLCTDAIAAERIAIGAPCDATCEDRILTHAYAAMTRGLMTTVARLRAAGARVLLVDVARNGGGSEWAEAAARIVSAKPLRSAAVSVRPGDAVTRKWRDLAALFRKEAIAAPRDRALLADLAHRADTIAAAAACTGGACPRVVPAGYAGGVLPALPAGSLDGRPWAVHAFSAAQFPYQDAVWKGPLIVLVDDETWSAAEEFAAVLRDNDAAVVMGTRTGGAGCGHIDGDPPTNLTHSQAVFEMPNCVRYRRDGQNEVSGIVPDVPTGARWNDGAAYAGRLTSARLGEAIALARRQHSQR